MRRFRRARKARGMSVARSLGIVAVAAAFLLTAWSDVIAQSGESSADGKVLVADVDGPIDQVMARFISRTLGHADGDGAQLVVLRIDTPGGRLDSTRDIVADILASPVPVVSFVAPPGARAASAGTFIAAAAGLAAMAPSTNIGAASPVGASGEDLDETLARKVKEDAAALIRSLAAQRGRNAEALEATVFEAVAYSAEEAVENNVVDLIAEDLEDLLAQLDGMSIPVAGGEETVHTAGAPVEEIGQNFIERALSFLTIPDVAFLLLSLGGLAIIVELWSPGLIGPGVVGVIMLLLAFAGIGNLPFSWAGVALIAVAFVLFFVETQVPGFGIFGIAGIVSLILGGVMLVGFFGAPGLPAPTVRVSAWTLAGMGGGAGLLMLWFVRELRRSRKAAGYVSPIEARALVGQTASVTVRLDPEGEVRVAGERWSARLPGGETADTGADVVVNRVEGLTLEVGLVAQARDAAREANR